MRRARQLLAVMAIATLGACEDDGTVITMVQRMHHMTLSDLWIMQRNGAVPVEVHGQPFPGVGAAEATEMLRPPHGGPQEIRFRAVPVGAVVDGWRMVLHFNPRGNPNPQRDCRASAPMETAAPRAEAFSVTMSFCKNRSWGAHGHLEARKTAEGDDEAYVNAMRTLIRVILREEPDR